MNSESHYSSFCLGPDVLLGQISPLRMRTSAELLTLTTTWGHVTPGSPFLPPTPSHTKSTMLLNTSPLPGCGTRHREGWWEEMPSHAPWLIMWGCKSFCHTPFLPNHYVRVWFVLFNQRGDTKVVECARLKFTKRDEYCKLVYSSFFLFRIYQCVNMRQRQLVCFLVLLWFCII